MEKTAQGQAGDYEYSCVMAVLSPILAKMLLEISKLMIPDSELYVDPKDPSYGRGDRPHITILYGIREDHKAIPRVQKVLTEQHPKECEIKSFGLFDGKPEYDVVILEVEGDELQSLNAAMAKEFPDHFNDTGAYKPHITLGFVKKGLGAKVLERVRTLDPQMTIPLFEFEFSSKDGSKQYLHP